MRSMRLGTINIGLYMVKQLLKISTALLFCAALIPVAYGKSCTPQEAEAADEMIDHLDSWEKINNARKQFGHCDDGSIAEGNSEAIARLLVDHWDTLPTLAELIKHNPSLRRFVLRHIDSTLDTNDLEKIKMLASSSCSKDLTALCPDLKKQQHALPDKRIQGYSSNGNMFYVIR